MTSAARIRLASWTSLLCGLAALGTAFIFLRTNQENLLLPLLALGLAAFVLGAPTAAIELWRNGRPLIAVVGASLGIGSVFAVMSLTSVTEAAARANSQGKLKQLMLAVHNYESVHGHLPGPVLGADGRPLLSWRVEILPYIEGEQLYKKFHLDEPWDSPHNLSLLPDIPSIFRVPRANPPYEPVTYYRAVVGPGSAFEHAGLRLEDITRGDGCENTMFLLEAGEAVPWTKPEEWEYDPNGPLPAVGGIYHPRTWLGRRFFADLTQFATGDGALHSLPRDTPEATWRALATRNGGEKIELP